MGATGASSGATTGATLDASLPSDAGRPRMDAATDARGGGRDAVGSTGTSGGGAMSDAAPATETIDGAVWNLVWSDEFNVDGPPNPADWNFEKGFVRNQELQWYQPDNASVQGGMLVIEGRREQVANPNYQAGSTDWKRSRQYAEYTSSSMTTSGKHAFTYGRYEMLGRIDTRQGSWPAFWTLGNGGWPQGGEVDIMEYYANKVLANVCKPTGSTCGWASTNQSPASLGGATWTNAFHLWAMEWNAQTIDLYLDGKVTNHFNVADVVTGGTTNPYVARPMYMLVNLALGANGGDPTNTTFPMRYEVDYVRVYQRAP